MDTQRTAIAQRCLNAAYEGSMAFPDIVGTPIDAGFEGYTVDYRRNTTTYYLPDGDSIMLDNRPSTEHVAPHFDQHGVAAQINWAQADPPDYSYPKFCQNGKRSVARAISSHSQAGVCSTSAAPPRFTWSIFRSELEIKPRSPAPDGHSGNPSRTQDRQPVAG